jgi:hypothetical protein
MFVPNHSIVIKPKVHLPQSEVTVDGMVVTVKYLK